MTPNIEEFLSQRLPESSVAAWGVRFGSRKTLSQCHTDWFVAEQVEQILQQLAFAANNLSQHRIEPVQLCWVFDRVRIFLALRHDDVCLGVIVENRPGQTFDTVQGVLEEFLALPEV